MVERGCGRRPCAPVEPAELRQFFIDGVSDLPTLIKTDTFHRRAADSAHDALFLADEPVRDAPPNRTLDENHHIGDRNVEQNGERVPQGVCVLGSVLDLI